MKNSLSEKWYMNHKLTVDLYYPDSNSSVSVRLNLSEEVIDNILYLAFCSNKRHWIKNADFIGDSTDKDIVFPITEGGYFVISNRYNSEIYVLDFESFLSGLYVLYSYDMASRDIDDTNPFMMNAEIADDILQYAIFDILGIIIQMKRRALYMIDDDEIIVDEELAEYFGERRF